MDQPHTKALRTEPSMESGHKTAPREPLRRRLTGAGWLLVIVKIVNDGVFRRLCT